MAWTIWFTGLSGSGKSTLASALSAHLNGLGLANEVVDGDAIRRELSSELGFSKEDRNENVRRICYVAQLLNRHNVVAIVAAIAPYREARDQVRSQCQRFVEVHVDCSMATLVERDVKGLYKRALAGDLPMFSGVTDPYEEPLQPDIYVNTGHHSKAECISRIIERLKALKYIPDAG